MIIFQRNKPDHLLHGQEINMFVLLSAKFIENIRIVMYWDSASDICGIASIVIVFSVLNDISQDSIPGVPCWGGDQLRLSVDVAPAFVSLSTEHLLTLSSRTPAGPGQNWSLEDYSRSVPGPLWGTLLLVRGLRAEQALALIVSRYSCRLGDLHWGKSPRSTADSVDLPVSVTFLHCGASLAPDTAS